MDIPVFNLSNLKKYFYYFLIICIVIGLLSIFGILFITDRETRSLIDSIDSWYFVVFLVLANFLFNRFSRKELNTIKQTIDYDLKFKKYESHYKKNLIWNGIAIALTGIIFNISPKDFFLYILFIQLLFLPAFYPGKTIISKQLGIDDIVFT